VSGTFSPKVAIVTGGGSGIGAAVAKELAATAGTRVIVADLSLEKAQATATEIGALAEAVQLDVVDSDQVDVLVKRVKATYGSLDLMFNSAGVSCYGEILKLTYGDWQRILKVNLFGVIAGSIAAYAVMAEQGSGHIINMGSMAAFLHDPLFAPYVTSKCGVVGFSRALACEAEGHGVVVSVVCPGNVRTPMLNDCEPSRFTPPISPQDAARRILDAASKKRMFVVFPFYARLIWWLDRLSPKLLIPIRREILRRARQRDQHLSGNH
jgi:NAD(P)-dependent dehydrogenase (short-subunit alcohol dehydrogenase family)